MSYVVCRTEKMNSFAQIGEAQAHNFRLGLEAVREHLDLTKENVLLYGTPNLLEDCKQRISEATPQENGKLRKNGVLAVEIFLSASPQHFVNDESITVWAEANLKWLKERYGKNLINAVMHLDEQTPQIHAFMVPIDDKNNLNCRAFYGGSKLMSKLQDEAYEAVQHLGIQRGIPKKITGATHKKTNVWRREQQEIENDIISITKALDKVPAIESNILGLVNAEKAHDHYIKKTLEQIKKTVPSKINSLTARNTELEKSERKARKDKEKAEKEKNEALKIAEEEKLKAATAEKMLYEITNIYNDSLKTAEKNAYKIALDFMNRQENKSKLEIAKKATAQTKIKIAKAFELEMTKEFEKKNITKEVAQNEITKMRDKINNIAKKKDNGLKR